MVVVDGQPVAVVIIFVRPSGPILQTLCAEGVTAVKHSGSLPKGSYNFKLGAVLRLLSVCCLGIPLRAEVH